MKYLVTIAAILIGSQAAAFGAQPSCDPSTQFKADQRTGSNDSTSFSFTLTIPLNKKKCERIEMDRRAKEAAETRNKELRNLEHLIKLCEQYPDSPLLRGKCNNEITSITNSGKYLGSY